MKNKLYTVRACRWGDRETHSYMVGVYSKKAKAMKAAEIEEDYRGGKYECEIQEWNIDEGLEGKMFDDIGMKVIKALPEINTLERRKLKTQPTN